MLLVIDVGNTSSAIGVYKNNTLIGNWRISTDKERTSDETGMFLISMLNTAGISPDHIRDVIMCSVVPPAMHSIVNAIKKYIKKTPLIVGIGVKTGINIKYENPKEIGSDKIVNAVAALKLYGGPVIIVDFGTATTFCAVNSKGDYKGGIICPGIKISAEALFSKASKLPRIEIVKPKHIIGRNTVNSMQSGIFYGFVGQVEYIVGLMKAEMGESGIKVVATGGMANLIASETKSIDIVNPNLSLEGLKFIYELNSKV
ncbi:MAG: type III pantothenate kinase [Clostridiaceae bacterium]|nr:type III pantothenate kinase [Clostridiaceae bacterium]